MPITVMRPGNTEQAFLGKRRAGSVPEQAAVSVSLIGWKGEEEIVWQE
ncbi:MAG: hypothetical protein IJU50_00355 [Lachnospiraceae bacterium]|nr:hypothetical protein [Lachnospiraceae bacterium]